MTKAIILFIYFSTIILHCVNAQNYLLPANIEKAFGEIPAKPIPYYFRNPAIKTPAGGHLQGIQAGISDAIYFVVITGNSKNFSYLFTAHIASLKRDGKIEDLQHLFNNPLRHAGGCQLSGDNLFIGVEDNKLKDKSSLVVVNPLDKNIRIIANRHGTYKRSTAGATAACETGDDTYFIIVGDWDSKNFDCYHYKEGARCDSFTTFQLPNSIKKCSYQSINLVQERSGIFYMIGTGTDVKGNRADLFRLNMEGNEIKAVLLKTRYFRCTHGGSFRYGAGIMVDYLNRLVIYSTQRRLGRNNCVNVFEKPADHVF